MRTRIESLLFLAREGSTACAVEQTDLQALVAEAVDSHRELIASKNPDVAIQSVPVQVQAPHGMAGSVVGNLLINAITTAITATSICVCSQDASASRTAASAPARGPGSRVRTALPRPEQPRPGLVLHLVECICDRLGWRIHIGSSAAGGTRVDIEFPTC
jgi:signal transduction histidine kinase